jgi:capsular polysaccharide biosynthesis protein
MKAEVNGRHATDRLHTESPYQVMPRGAAVTGHTEPRPVERPEEPPRPPRRRLVRRQWTRLALLTVILVVLGAVGGSLVAASMPTQYAAHAQVVYALTREQPTGFLREDRNISTQLVLLESRAVLDPVAAEWGTSVDDLTAALSANVMSESEIIDIQFVDSDPERAKDILSWVVQQYLVVANSDARSDVQNYLDSELFTVLDRIDAVRSGPASGQDQLAPLVEREQWLRTQLDELRMTDLVGPGALELVQPYVDPTPISPQPAVATGAGAVTGWVVAVLLVALLARRMTRPDRSRT